jgi:hypothetical protein
MSVSLTLHEGLTIGKGITFGSGSGGGGTSFTITSSDLSNPSNYYSGYSNYSPSGFTSDGNYLYNGIYYEITPGLYNTILAAQTAAGFNPSNAWVWNANFTSGGSCLVRLGLINGSPNDVIVIAPIDQTDTQWQTGSLYGPTLPGTFTFPATFTAYSPATSMNGNNSWC